MSSEIYVSGFVIYKNKSEVIERFLEGEVG